MRTNYGTRKVCVSVLPPVQQHLSQVHPDPSAGCATLYLRHPGGGGSVPTENPLNFLFQFIPSRWFPPAQSLQSVKCVLLLVLLPCLDYFHCLAGKCWQLGTGVCVGGGTQAGSCGPLCGSLLHKFGWVKSSLKILNHDKNCLPGVKSLQFVLKIVHSNVN